MEEEREEINYEDDRLCEKLGIPYLDDYSRYTCSSSSKYNKRDRIEVLQSMDINTLFDKALCYNDMRMVKISINEGVEIMQKHMSNCINYNVKIVRILLHNYKGKVNKSIDHRYILYNVNEDAFIYLLKQGFEINIEVFRRLVLYNHRTAVHYILSNKLIKKVDKLIPTSEEMCEILFDSGNYKLEDLNINKVVKECNINTLKFLVKEGLVLTTNLLNRSIKGNYNTSYYILAHGIEPNSDTLYEAIVAEEYDLVRILNSKNIKIDDEFIIKLIQSEDEYGYDEYVEKYITNLDKISDKLLDKILLIPLEGNLDRIINIIIDKKLIDIKDLYKKVKKENMDDVLEYLNEILSNQV